MYGAAVDKQTKCLRVRDKGGLPGLAGRAVAILYTACLKLPYEIIHRTMLSRWFPLQEFLSHGAAVDTQTKCARVEDKELARSLAGSTSGILH